MQVLQVLSTYAAVAVGLLSGYRPNQPPNRDGFRCTQPVPQVGGQEATVAFCGHPIFAGQETPTSFTDFQAATPVGRSPVDHYDCVNGPEPLYPFCCVSNTMREHAITAQEVYKKCHMMG